MDKKERGPLLADQEEAQQKIANIKEKLNGMAALWAKLAQSIISNPDKIIFSNAPENLGKLPPSLGFGSGLSFNWNEIPKIEIVAQLIQDLREEQSRLADIQQKLRA